MQLEMRIACTTPASIIVIINVIIEWDKTLKAASEHNNVIYYRYSVLVFAVN